MFLVSLLKLNFFFFFPGYCIIGISLSARYRDVVDLSPQGNCKMRVIHDARIFIVRIPPIITRIIVDVAKKFESLRFNHEYE